MKNLNIVLIIATLLGTWLFYQHGIGINLLIFTVVLLMASLWLNPLIIGNKKTSLAIIGTLLTAVNVVWHHSGLAVFMNIVSLMMLAGLILNPQSSYFVASINSMYSFLSSILIKGIEWLDDQFYGERNTLKKPKLSRIKIVSILFPVTVALGFMIMYASANPKLESIFAQMNLAFINWSLIKFTLFTYIVLFGFFYQTQVSQLTTADAKASNLLKRKKQKRFNLNFLALKYELKSGWLLFLLLNLILFGFHLVDAFHLMGISGNGEIDHSAYLHQSVNTLIFSILLAIGVILYYFRGNLNFYKKNQKLKFLVYAWIAQNLILIATTALKNYQYIADYGLTYKRIGVYFYLVLTLVGLMTTLIKTKYLKSTWYLLRANSFALYLVLLLATFFNGDNIITKYNLSQTTSIDINYLLGLSNKNIAQMKQFAQEHPHLITYEQNQVLLEKEKTFMLEQLERQWFSWNYTDHNNEIKLLGHEQ